MSLFEDNSKQSLIDISNTVHEVGYESLLLVYDSFLDNAVITVANTINENHSFKYIIAVRTYSVSPEYLAGMYETFEKLYPGRVTFNIIPGNIKFQETSLKDVVLIEDQIKTQEQRDIYTVEWLKKYNKLSIKKNLPPLMLSGHTVDFQKTSFEYGITNIMQMGDFLNQGESVIKNKNQIVSVAISIKDADESINDRLKKIIAPHSSYTIFGDKDDIYIKLCNLEEYGVSDVLIHQLPDGRGSSGIHSLIKDIKNRAMPFSKEMI